jgi:hypothetical protein
MSRFHLNLIGVLILLLGLGSVALIERNVRVQEATAMEDTEETHALLHPEDSREYVHNTEMMGGKMTIIIDGWWQSVTDLGHSRGFAMVVAVLSLGVAGAVFAKSNLSTRE